ncbi:hypothetical protein SDC9_197646 [bioreactor metagenome]|uniref:Uncharacterized protein n=1 Tax=bioreactor metagenome TaxID=1076179 RepID=A0A645IFC1_9ZZZZ
MNTLTYTYRTLKLVNAEVIGNKINQRWVAFIGSRHNRKCCCSEQSFLDSAKHDMIKAAINQKTGKLIDADKARAIILKKFDAIADKNRLEKDPIGYLGL